MELLSSFSQVKSSRISQALAEPETLALRRAAAWGEFARSSWPDRKSEAFKYTDLSRVPLEGLELLAPMPVPVPQSLWERVEQSQLAGYLIFVDGVLAASQVPQGIQLAPLSQILAQDPGSLAAYLYQAVGAEGKFRAQNAAFWQEGVFLRVPAALELKEPLGVFHHFTRGGFFAQRTLLILGENAHAVFLEEFSSDNSDSLVISLASEAFLAPGAGLRRATLQTLNESAYLFGFQNTILEHDAQQSDLVASFGAKTARLEVSSQMVGAGSDSEMLGIYFAHGDQHFDHYTLQHHLADHARSDVFYKGAARDQGEVVYSGLIRLEVGAQKTDAYQTNRNLLLSPEARAHSVPMLEILANDVRCSHGSSTSPVDREQVFYLMSRGIPREQAQEVLVQAFLADVLGRVPLMALRERVEQIIREKVQL